MASLLGTLAAPNPFRPTPPTPKFQVFTEGRDSSTREIWREPTEWLFDTYGEADAYADQLNLGDQIDFWYVADEAEEDDQ